METLFELPDEQVKVEEPEPQYYVTIVEKDKVRRYAYKSRGRTETGAHWRAYVFLVDGDEQIENRRKVRFSNQGAKSLITRYSADLKEYYYMTMELAERSG